MDKDRIEGAAHRVKGALKEGVGKVTGDAKTEAEGAAEKAAEGAKRRWGGQGCRPRLAEEVAEPASNKGAHLGGRRIGRWSMVARIGVRSAPCPNDKMEHDSKQGTRRHDRRRQGAEAQRQ